MKSGTARFPQITLVQEAEGEWKHVILGQQHCSPTGRNCSTVRGRNERTARSAARPQGPGTLPVSFVPAVDINGGQFLVCGLSCRALWRTVWSSGGSCLRRPLAAKTVPNRGPTASERTAASPTPAWLPTAAACALHIVSASVSSGHRREEAGSWAIWALAGLAVAVLEVVMVKKMWPPLPSGSERAVTLTAAKRTGPRVRTVTAVLGRRGAQITAPALVDQ